MDICVSTFHFLTVVVKFVPGEVHLGYDMTGCVVLCTCILPVVVSGGHMFLLICRTICFDTDGHFLLHLLCPLYINLFQLDSHGLIDKLFPKQEVQSPLTLLNIQYSYDRAKYAM